jgi:hypothetical protein
MRFRNWVFGLVVMFWAGFVCAQYRNTSPAGDPSEYLRGQSGIGLQSLRGLLDPSRMHMSHSVSFGYASIGGQSVTQGLYLNRLDYQISKPLFLTTHFGYHFQPSGPAEWNPANNGSQIVGGAELNWQPTPATSLRVSYYHGLYPQSRYYDDYYWGPYDYRAHLDRP